MIVVTVTRIFRVLSSCLAITGLVYGYNCHTHTHTHTHVMPYI